MRKILLTLSILCASLFLLALLSVLALRYWFNPNTLIAPLSHQIQQKTGLVLRVEGELSWHIFPRAHMTVKQLSLQPTDPQKNATAIRIQTLRAHLSLWPLITDKKLVIDDIMLEGLELTLQPNSLPTLQKNTDQPVTATDTAATKTLSSPAKKSISFAIKSITLRNATLHGVLESIRPNATLYLSDFTVQNLESNTSVRTIPLEMTAKIVSNGNTLPISLNSTVVFDATKHSLSTSDLLARINTLTIQGNLSAKKTSATTQWQSQLTLEDKNVADTLHLLTGTNNAFIQTLQGTVAIAANFQKIDVSAFNLKLNGDTVTGSAAYDLKQHHLTSVLNANTVHLSTLNIPSTAAVSTDNTAAAQTANTVARTSVAPKDNGPAFSADSQLHIQHLLYNTLSLDNISGQLHYANQSLNLNPFTVTVLQGLYQGKIAVTLNNTRPLMIAGTLSHLNLALLQQYLGANPSVTGLLDVQGTLNSQGQSQKQRLSNLNGNIAVAIHQGSWTKLNMSNILGLLNLASGKRTVTTSNGFSSVSGDFAIRNGIANNPNLKLMSPLLSVKGNGSLNLVVQTLDYHVMLHPDPSVLQQVNGLSQWLKQDIPLTIKGPWTSPNIQLDQGALIRTTVQDQLDDTLKKVRGLIILH